MSSRRRREPEDVVAVERRDEGAVDETDDFGCQAIAFVLVLLDLRDRVAAVVRVCVEEIDEQLRDLHDVRRGVREQLEEFPLLRLQAQTHGGLLPDVTVW
jgi:hypothetical protein